MYEQTAEKLRAAYSGETLPPLRHILEPEDVDGAYKVQDINTRFWVSQGRKIVGRKIGLTSPAVQKQLGVSQPDFGALFDDMLVKNGGDVSSAGLIQPKAEAEVAIVLSRELNLPDCTPENVAAAADYAVCSLEIVDSRISDWKISFADTVADNGSAALFVLGDEKKSLKDLDLYSCGMVLEVNDQVASVGAGAACLGHPLNAAAWLARTLAKRGEPLREGDILLTGALGPMVNVSAGDKIRAQIGGLGECSFTNNGAST